MRREIPLFLGLTAVCSAPGMVWVAATGTLGVAGGTAVLLIMWGPGVAALLTCRLTGRPIADLGWRWPSTRDVLLATFVPVAYAGLAYAVLWGAGLGGFPNRETLASMGALFGPEPIGATAGVALWILAFPVSVATGLVFGLGEEIGWRGYLVPRLRERMSFAATGVVSGIIWGLWHTPLILLADYNTGAPAWFTIPCFVVLTIAGAIVFAWLRLRSGSLWTAAILHAAHNVAVQRYLTPLTVVEPQTKWYIDEFGALLPASCLLFALGFLARSREV